MPSKLSDEAEKYGVPGERVAFVITADVVSPEADEQFRMSIDVGYFGPADLRPMILAKILSDILAGNG